jgi:hypothetical protein
MIFVQVASSYLLSQIYQLHSSKLKAVIQSPSMQWLVSLLKIKHGYACDVLTHRIQPWEKYEIDGNFMWMTILSHQGHLKWLLAILWFGISLRSARKLGIIMNFNDQRVTWDTKNTPIQDRDTVHYHQQKPWLRYIWAQMTQKQSEMNILILPGFLTLNISMKLLA